MSRIINRCRLALTLLAVALFCAALLLVAYSLKKQRDVADQNHTALVALCAQRHDLDLRISATQKVLDDHHGQRLIFGIPRSLIRSGLNRDRTTRTNLSILDCTGGTK